MPSRIGDGRSIGQTGDQPVGMLRFMLVPSSFYCLIIGVLSFARRTFARRRLRAVICAQSVERSKKCPSFARGTFARAQCGLTCTIMSAIFVSVSYTHLTLPTS